MNWGATFCSFIVEMQKEMLFEERRSSRESLENVAK
jgi:hypothetical protein